MYTSAKENTLALPLYRKYLDIEDSYNNPNNINYDNTILINSKSLHIDLVVPKWNNRSIKLKQLAIDELEGYIVFTHSFVK